ncbi:hypothetical protein GCM10027214_04320 [Stenotrophomonas tumulicola]
MGNRQECDDISFARRISREHVLEHADGIAMYTKQDICRGSRRFIPQQRQPADLMTGPVQVIEAQAGLSFHRGRGNPWVALVIILRLGQ